jgi:hypothetical protein
MTDGIKILIKDNLGQAKPIPEVNKYQLPHIPASVDPSYQDDLATNIISS